MNFLQAIATLLLKAMGWKIRKDVPEIPKKCVAIGAPHVSWVDMLIGVGGAVILKLKVKVLIKAEVFRFPWKGIFKALGGIPVDRYSSKAAGDRKKLVQEVVKKLETEKEFVLVLSPEGHRRKVNKGERRT